MRQISTINSGIKCPKCGWHGSVVGEYPYIAGGLDTGAKFRCPGCNKEYQAAGYVSRPPEGEHTLTPPLRQIDVIGEARILGARLVKEKNKATALALLSKYNAKNVMDVGPHNWVDFINNAYKILDGGYKMKGNCDLYKATSTPQKPRAEGMTAFSCAQEMQESAEAERQNIQSVLAICETIENAQDEISVIYGVVRKAERELEAFGLSLCDTYTLLAKRRDYRSKKLLSELLKPYNKLMESVND